MPLAPLTLADLESRDYADYVTVWSCWPDGPWVIERSTAAGYLAANLRDSGRTSPWRGSNGRASAAFPHGANPNEP